MSRLCEAAAVDRALRKVAQLRALFRRLPHQPTPAETRLLAEFDALHADDRAADIAPAAVRAGFRAAWAARDYGKIVSVAARLDPRFVEADPVIRTLLHHATTRVRETAGGPS